MKKANQQNRVKSRPKNTHKPEKDLKNIDIRKFLKKDQPRELFEEQTCIASELQSQKSDNPQSTTDLTQNRSKQLKLTDKKYQSYFPEEKLGVFNFKPEDPEKYKAKCFEQEKEGRNSLYNKKETCQLLKTNKKLDDFFQKKSQIPQKMNKQIPIVVLDEESCTETAKGNPDL